MKNKFIEMRNMNKHYGGVHALKDFEFDLEAGEIHCLVGQNGCGKSTLIKIISGVISYDEGGVMFLDGKEAHNLNAQKSMDAGIRVIYQDLSLFPNLSVAENIAFAIYNEGKNPNVNWKENYEVAKRALDLIHVNMEPDAPVESLSIAERQLVAIARALAANAKLLIMDEPTSSLTRKEVNTLFGIIRELKSKDITILFVSHKLDEIIEIADRITAVRDGVKIKTCDKKGMNSRILSELISGESISYVQDFPDVAEETILSVKGLSNGRQYKDLSFDLKKGEILGIIGLLGSGRTEAAMTIFGMNPPDAGEICVEGETVSFASNQDAIKKGIAYVPEDRLLQGLIVDQDMESNITLSVIDRIKKGHGTVDHKECRRITEHWIRTLNIKSAKPGVKASAMSGGNQQKAVIAKWLATNPKILILDQPTNGIDVGAKNAIYNIIRQLAKDGMSIILISDEIPEIYYNCPRAFVMHRGRLVKELNCGSMTENEFQEEVFHVQ